ncbi:MAG: holo-ACP synthase [Caldiserica bacterium]|nr:holo-ACP synthase [Caldisericota bacterium]
MKIKNIGIFIVEVARIETTVKKFGKRFIKRVFHPEELLSLNPLHISGKMAGKIAVSRIIGGVCYKDIKITSQGGKPEVILQGKARIMAEKNNIRSIKLSISHEKKRALAIAVGIRL